MRRSAPLLVLVVSLAALGGEPSELPARLEPSKGRLRFELSLATSWTSSDHKLRSMSDEAKLEATFDVTPREGGVVEAAPRAVDFARRKHGRVAGFFSDSEPDAKGSARWTQGGGTAPPTWSMIVSPRGEAVADATSAAPTWRLEGWLHNFDKHADEDARLRRLVHYLDVGFFGAPLLAPGSSFEVVSQLEVGESGLTNKLVLIEVTHLLTVTREADVLRVAGPVKSVKLLRGEGGAKRVDQWLDVAFTRGGPNVGGELVAIFDPAKKSWRDVRSTLSLEWTGRVEGGSGRARFERKLRATWE
ncbi:MAG: hypothetical protein ACAI25_11980 [Planctomycetota bacterium]